MKGTIIMSWAFVGRLKPWVQCVLWGVACAVLAACVAALQGCSAPGELASQAQSDLEQRCGWVQSQGSPYAPDTDCQIVRTDDAGGLFRVGDDPCTVPAAKTLRVEAGEPYASWVRFGRSAMQTATPCHP